MNSRSVKKRLFFLFASIFLPGLLLAAFFATHRGEPAQKNLHLDLTEEDRQEITMIIKGAVEDNSWWEAASECVLRQSLARYYTGPILNEISSEAWKFICKPTDWYWPAFVKEIKICRYTRNGLSTAVEIVEAEAKLEIKDLVLCQTEQGKAVYALKKTGEGWRIFFVRYDWNTTEKSTRTGDETD